MAVENDFFESVRQAAVGTPYVVERTERGFDVCLDLADTQWYEIAYKSGLMRLVSHHVTLEPSRGRYAILDESRRIEWKAGVGPGTWVPRLSGERERTVGRLHQVETRKVFAFRKDGSWGKVADYRFDTRQGHRLIRGAARSLGWKERQPLQVLFAMWMAGLSIAGMLLGGIGVLIAWALGLI